MYLESGAFGPYYTLHDFKCTHPLDNLKKLKLLKVAGLLRFKVGYKCGLRRKLLELMNVNKLSAQ